MTLPPFLQLPSENAYRQHFEMHFVNGGPIVTYDGIQVRFFNEGFDHAFYRDSSRTANDKAVFDFDRAERMPWISAVLKDVNAEVYRRVMRRGQIRRIALMPSDRYVVIIQLKIKNQVVARFITAYVVDSSSALLKMRSNPKW